MGLPSGNSTLDYCCQACGYRFSLAPMMRVWVAVVMTVLFVWTCLFPMITAPMAAYSYWPYYRNPIVPDAPYPPLRFRSSEPLRRCAKCGGVSRCTSVTRTRSRGIPTGTTYDYSCEQCKATFTLSSMGGHIFNLVGAIVCFLFGFGCMPVGLIFWLAAVVVLAISASQLFAELKNPLIAEKIAEEP